MIEVKFSFLEEKINRYDFLKKCYSSIIKSKVLNKGSEHDSSHYMENIVYKWSENNVKIKLYIDDYSENGLCFDISSNSQGKCNEISKKLVKLLQLESIDIQMTKNWES